MKRVGNLFDSITERTNVQLAVWKALRGKRRRPEACVYVDKLETRIDELIQGLQAGTFPVGRFHQFLIRDPKERVITAPCFDERVLHHAIMNVCEPHFERWLIADSYACRVGKGRCLAIQRAREFAHSHEWFLSLDVRKYFDSIHHQTLKNLVARRIKDARLSELFDRIIDSYRGALGRGVPIGSLTSQHLANFYLDPLDRFVKESLRFKGYVRYMDDMVIWGHSRQELGDALRFCTEFARDQLKIEFKPTPFINKTKHGLDFLGARVFPTHLVLNRRSRVRYVRKVRELRVQLVEGRIGELAYQTGATALTAFATSGGIRSWNFRRHLLSNNLVDGHTARTE